MTEGLMIRGKDSSKVRGVAASVMHGIREEDRNSVVDLISEGLTLDNALEVIALNVSDRTGKILRETRTVIENENPFRPS